jgi:hypothetical protein
MKIRVSVLSAARVRQRRRRWLLASLAGAVLVITLIVSLVLLPSDPDQIPFHDLALTLLVVVGMVGGVGGVAGLIMFSQEEGAWLTWARPFRSNSGHSLRHAGNLRPTRTR